MFCMPPCVNNTSDPIPGAIPPVFNPLGLGATDENMVVAAGDANPTIGTWEEIMPADAARIGASIKNTDGAATIYVLQRDTGVPASGSQPGEVAIAAGATYTFPVQPKKRYIVRGTIISAPYALTTW